MTEPQRPLTIGIVAGEESGDLLAADLVRSLRSACGRDVRLVGVGGPRLIELGLRPLFDAHEIAIVGVGAVLTAAPRIARRIAQATQAIADAEPDCVVTVDVPDFSLRVARRVRRRRVAVPVVHYVCPSVWAWRPGRAKAMSGFVDHVLCLLPFEPSELERLGGPPGTFVGHRLSHEAGVVFAGEAQLSRRPAEDHKTLLLLPGSRRGEVSRLLGDFREVVASLTRRTRNFRLVLPTIDAVRGVVEAETQAWPIKPVVTSTPHEKWQAFAAADAAIIASGTVSLELALCRVPHVSTYRLDMVGRSLKRLIQSWSASLPNLIADRPIVPEFFDSDIRPAAVARHVEALWDETPLRQWQRDGFAAVARAMHTTQPAGEISASIVLDLIARRTGGV
jgi:lipid-A-disaccharide synthase